MGGAGDCHYGSAAISGGDALILITGGLGFIGSHTTQALLDLDESCVLVQRRPPTAPRGLVHLVGHRIFIEQADINDFPALLALGNRHKITGIVHLGGSVPWPPGADTPIEGARKALDSLLNVLSVAAELGVPRVATASAIGVYGGVAEEPPYREDIAAPDDRRSRDPNIQKDRRIAR